MHAPILNPPIQGQIQGNLQLAIVSMIIFQGTMNEFLSIWKILIRIFFIVFNWNHHRWEAVNIKWNEIFYWTDLLKFFKLISALRRPLRSSFSTVDGIAAKNSIAWNALNLLSLKFSILKMNPQFEKKNKKCTLNLIKFFLILFT